MRTTADHLPLTSIGGAFLSVQPSGREEESSAAEASTLAKDLYDHDRLFCLRHGAALGCHIGPYDDLYDHQPHRTDCFVYVKEQAWVVTSALTTTCTTICYQKVEGTCLKAWLCSSHAAWTKAAAVARATSTPRHDFKRDTNNFVNGECVPATSASSFPVKHVPPVMTRPRAAWAEGSNGKDTYATLRLPAT
ncbi:hypothetical protein MRX96_033216 [Rhipicephalus microplus]